MSLTQIQHIEKQLNILQKDLPADSIIQSDLAIYSENLMTAKEFLANPNFKISFIGDIGCGKTTAICKLLGLEVNNSPLLATGSGRTTLCEVIFKESTQDYIEILPLSACEAKNLLTEFAQSIDQKANKSKGKLQDRIISSELDHFLRNFLTLPPVKGRTKDNKPFKKDPALDLHNELKGNFDLFLEHILAKAALEKRNTCHFHYLPNQHNSYSEWLKSTFSSINFGHMQDAPIPQQIKIHSTNISLSTSSIAYEIIDTKGVDQSIFRKDLTDYFENDNTLLVLCSEFNSAPGTTISNLLATCNEANILSKVVEKSVLLILDRPNDAISVSTINEKTIEAGREERWWQVQEEFEQQFGLDSLDICFFNAVEEHGDEIFEYLSGKLESIHDAHQKTVADIEQAVHQLANEAKREISKQQRGEIRKVLAPWIKQARIQSPNVATAFKDISMEILKTSAHVSSVRASINRQGNWNNFNFYEILALSERKQAASAFRKSHEALQTLLENMLERNDLIQSHQVIGQLLHSIKDRIHNMYSLALEHGRTCYQPNVMQRHPEWTTMQNEWGKGQGYKGRVATQCDNLFSSKANHEKTDKELNKQLAAKWFKLIKKIESFID
ncbi:MAG: hypothetical protein ACERJ1_08570 [Halodesulfovibrio sp.]|uniref:hypothetical protein n=1 Tax=Halodesulfovibrio sp. TaxID=1912772 RepID=UPI00359E4142